MKKGILLVMLIIICMSVLSGCQSRNQKKEIETLNQRLKISEKNLKENQDLYNLRNILDSRLYNILDSLIKGDYVLAKQNLAKNVRISGKKILSELDGVENEFIIPDRRMNLRQRAYMLKDGKYMAIYEIFDEGYNHSNKYDDRIWTLNVNYIKSNGAWKLSYIKIDE